MDGAGVNDEGRKQAERGAAALARLDDDAQGRATFARSKRKDSGRAKLGGKRAQHLGQAIHPADERQPAAGTQAARAGCDPVGQGRMT